MQMCKAPVWYMVSVVDVTAKYNTIQYNTKQYNTMQCNAMQYNTMQYNTMQYNAMQYNAMPASSCLYFPWLVQTPGMEFNM